MFSIVIAGLALLSSAAECQPVCSCVRLGPVSQARAGNELIFEGRVLQIRNTTIWRTYGPTLRHERYERRVVMVRIHSVWKGALGDTVRVLTGYGGGDCGYPFDEGKDYVVFADRFDDPGPAAGRGLLQASICSHTTDARDAAPVRTALGKPPRERGDD
jgi:hypothetical protein